MARRKMNGVELIAAERKRQIEVEGYTPEADKGFDIQLASAAACYALPAGLRGNELSSRFAPSIWPWARAHWKPTPDDRKRELVKAGALIAAAIDALDE